MSTVVLLLVAAFPTFALVHGFRTGKSIVRFPRPTYRDESPLWFWFGQAMFVAMLIIIVLLLAEATGVPRISN